MEVRENPLYDICHIHYYNLTIYLQKIHLDALKY